MKEKLTDCGKRLYYSANPQLGWHNGFTKKIYYEIVEPELYDVYTTYLPRSVIKKLRFVNRWFRHLDNHTNVPTAFRRRQTNREGVERALLMMGRVDNILSSGRMVEVGSRHLDCPVAWCVFGNCDKLPVARYYFDKFNDLYRHYKRNLHGPFSQKLIHLRRTGEIFYRLGTKHDMTANIVIAIAILLLSDIILNCGPDCVTFCDSFSNDCRDNDKSSIEPWRETREKVLGKGYVKSENKNYGVAIYNQPRTAYINNTVKIVEQEVVNDDLAAGERTVRATSPTFHVVSRKDNDYQCKSSSLSDSDHPTMADIPSMWGNLQYGYTRT